MLIMLIFLMLIGNVSYIYDHVYYSVVYYIMDLIVPSIVWFLNTNLAN